MQFPTNEKYLHKEHCVTIIVCLIMHNIELRLEKHWTVINVLVIFNCSTVKPIFILHCATATNTELSQLLM